MNTSRQSIDSTIQDRIIIESFARLDRLALGVAVGSVTGLSVFLATAILLLKGGDRVGPNLILLAQYFIGYSVTWPGSVIGFVYGFVAGFLLGWSAAVLRNFVLAIYLRIIRLKANLSSAQDILDNF